MNLFGYTFSKQTPVTQIEVPKVQADSFSAFQFSRPEIPIITEKRNQEWISFGELNNYPLRLKEFLSTCAMHNAIVQGKTQMMAGKGLLINGAKTQEESLANYNALDAATKEGYDAFILNENGEPIRDIILKASLDWQTYGAMAFEVVWSVDFSRVALIKYVCVEHIRSGKFEDNGKVCEYYYSRDWTKIRQEEYTPKRIQAFGSDEEKEYSQLIYVKNGTNEYYGEPSYKGALSWINIESQMGLYHLSNIENGFSPSMTFKFYKNPSGPEERQMIVSNIKKQFGGAKNAGRALIFFSDGKELAPDVEPVAVNNIDKQFIVLADQAVQQILSGHRVTSPLLFGISTPGQLSANAELPTAFNIFDKVVIEPDRMILARTLNTMLESSGVKGVKIMIEQFNPLI